MQFLLEYVFKIGGVVSTILYIGGLRHSGSTLLNLLLSTGGKAVALGEAARTICRAPEIKENGFVPAA